MINLDSITNENNKEHNEKWPYIPDYPYRILIIGGSGAGKTNTLINLINEQDDINKIYLYAKDLSKPKYEFLIKKCKNAGMKHLNDLNAFIECSNTMMTFMRILMIKNQTEKKNLIVFDDMIADIMTNKKFQAIIKELFITCRKLKKIYRECTRNPNSFLTIDTTLTASNPRKFRKKLFSSCKDDSN